MVTKLPAGDADIDLGLGNEEIRLHPILSNEEVLAARARARKKVEAERKLAAIEALEVQETERLRLEEGLTTGVGVLDEIVNVTIDLPPFAPDIKVNFHQTFVHGYTYPVPRHQADTLREQMARAWRHEDEVKGRSFREHYGLARHATISKVGDAVQAPEVVYRPPAAH
jgi:hypothetical protein